MPAPELGGDLPLALALIAAELGVDVDALPRGVESVLRSLSNAHYSAGVRDGMARRPRVANDVSSNVTSSNVTPVVGPHGRRRFSARPTPLMPPLRKSER